MSSQTQGPDEEIGKQIASIIRPDIRAYLLEQGLSYGGFAALTVDLFSKYALSGQDLRGSRRRLANIQQFLKLEIVTGSLEGRSLRAFYDPVAQSLALSWMHLVYLGRTVAFADVGIPKERVLGVSNSGSSAGRRGRAIWHEDLSVVLQKLAVSEERREEVLLVVRNLLLYCVSHYRDGPAPPQTTLYFISGEIRTDDGKPKPPPNMLNVEVKHYDEVAERMVSTPLYDGIARSDFRDTRREPFGERPPVHEPFDYSKPLPPLKPGEEHPDPFAPPPDPPIDPAILEEDRRRGAFMEEMRRNPQALRPAGGYGPPPGAPPGFVPQALRPAGGYGPPPGAPPGFVPLGFVPPPHSE